MNIIVLILFIGVFIFPPLWRIFSRAGLNPALSLVIFIPAFGMLICAAILASSTWKITPSNLGEK